MEIKIVFDNETKNKKYFTGWGFSAIINNTILFDTGKDPESLISNMNNMNIETAKLEAVIISHDHWDHTGGLWELLKLRPGLIVYSCPHFSQEFKRRVASFSAHLIEVDTLTGIAKGIYTTGEIEGKYKGTFIGEQSLIVKTHRGICVITGCAHPGIRTILDRVKNFFHSDSIYLVLGGFHLKDTGSSLLPAIMEKFKELHVAKICPAHCTGQRAIQFFKANYKEDCIESKIGQTLYRGR
ncbi:MAG: MBL fold metallo-hydrolase [bacterium]